MPDLRAFRLTAGLSQSEAARLLRIPVRTLQGYESGRTPEQAAREAWLLALLTGQERLPAWRRPITAPPPASPNSPKSAR